MESKAKFLGHPVHQMLAVFPLGLLATAPVFDLIGLIRSNSLWLQMSFWMIAAGLLGAGCSLVRADRLAVRDRKQLRHVDVGDEMAAICFGAAFRIPARRRFFKNKD
jgi:hypothetical protein